LEIGSTLMLVEYTKFGWALKAVHTLLENE
jgi:hypothetical protein